MYPNLISIYSWRYMLEQYIIFSALLVPEPHPKPPCWMPLTGDHLPGDLLWDTTNFNWMHKLLNLSQTITIQITYSNLLTVVTTSEKFLSILCFTFTYFYYTKYMYMTIINHWFNFTYLYFMPSLHALCFIHCMYYDWIDKLFPFLPDSSSNRQTHLQKQHYCASILTQLSNS